MTRMPATGYRCDAAGALRSRFFAFLAESEGFEPPSPFGLAVFKTAAFDRSANSPDEILPVRMEGKPLKPWGGASRSGASAQAQGTTSSRRTMFVAASQPGRPAGNLNR